MPRATTRCGTTRNCLATFSGQAWIVNDIGLGVVAMLYTWVIYPLRQKTLAKVPIRIMRPAAAIVVVGFVVLCVVKFS